MSELRLNNGQPLSDERKALAEACLDDGWSFRQIAMTHRISAKTLRRYFPGRGMDLHVAAQLGAAGRKFAQAERKNRR